MIVTRICFVGDSMVNGTGDPDCLGWSGRICAAAQRAGHDLTYYNLGIRRETSADIAGRWREEVARRLPPEVDGRVVFSFGLNDVTLEDGRPRVPLEASVEHARRIFGEAARAYPTLVVGPPPTTLPARRPLLVELAGRYQRLCQELAIPYLDVLASLERSGLFVREALEHDGAHPRAAGYAEWAGLVERWAAWQAWLRQE